MTDLERGPSSEQSPSMHASSLNNSPQSYYTGVVERLRERLGFIEAECMCGENLAVTLCTSFDNPDQERCDETGWTPDAEAGCNQVLNAIHAHYATIISELQAERDQARQLVAEANNSLFGSQAYFHSLNGGEFDKYHLSRGIEQIKDDSRLHWQSWQAAESSLSRIKSETVEAEWQPIESAPRDGTEFLAWKDSDRGPFKCWWHTDWPRSEAYWMDSADSEPAPTHWRPMIKPPAIRSLSTDDSEKTAESKHSPSTREG